MRLPAGNAPVTMKALDEHINTMIDVLADIFFNSLFSESVLDIERKCYFRGNRNV